MVKNILKKMKYLDETFDHILLISEEGCVNHIFACHVILAPLTSKINSHILLFSLCNENSFKMRTRPYFTSAHLCTSYFLTRSFKKDRLTIHQIITHKLRAYGLCV